MIVYFLLFFVSTLLTKCVAKTGKTVPSKINEEANEHYAAFGAAILAFLPTIIMMGLRESVGDTPNYIEGFNSASTDGSFFQLFSSLSQRNPGYEAVLKLFKKYISDNANAWLLFLTAISIALMLKTVCKYSLMFALSTFVFFGSTEIVYVFNGARQFFAMAVMLLALKYMSEKKLLKYALVCLAAWSIHQTAVIAIPAYFIVRGKFLNKKMILTVIGTIAATAFSSFFIDYLNDLFIEDSVYSHYYDNLVTSAGLNMFRVLVAAVPPILCLVYKKRIEALDDPVLNICANMSLLAFAVSLFSSTSGGDLLGRLAEYFLIYNTILYPLLLKRVVSKKVYHIILIGIAIGFTLFFTYQFYIKWELGYDSAVLGISIGMED